MPCMLRCDKTRSEPFQFWPYLAESVRRTADVEDRCHLRSSTTMTLVVPSVQRSTLGDRAFPVGHGTAYHLPSELFHPSPPFGNN